jgi:PemK-like, MazF-like toxin of type II toxin-antitoxin system
MWAMMQKFRICAGAVNVLSAKLLMGISWSGGAHAKAWALPAYRATDSTTQSWLAPMLEIMASQWSPWRRILKNTEHLVFNEAPKLIRQLPKADSLQRGIQQGLKMGLDAGLSALAGVSSEVQPAITAGRPVTESSVPTAHRARRVVYSPDLDGRADPGEIVWTWVVFEDDPTRGKDRPVLVVGRDSATLLGLMLSSQDRHQSDRDWLWIGRGDWDYEGRASWVRLDRVLDVPEEGIRREGAVLDRDTFEVVATRLRAEYSWS